jgi:hypothetical protein
MLPTSAFAQSSDADRATARVLGQEGQDALDKKDFKTAEDCFKRADSLFHAPTLALGLARSYAGGGKFVAAQEAYNRVVREGTPVGAPEVFKRAVQEATAELAQIAPKIAAVTITVTGADAPKVTLDDASVPTAALGVKRPVDPGSHVVKATADGFAPAELKFSVVEGGTATAQLTLEKVSSVAASGPASGAPIAGVSPAAGATGSDTVVTSTDTGSGRVPSKTIGIIALGVGAAGLATGAITGLMAMGKASDLKDRCVNGACPADQQSNIDSYKTFGLVSTIGFVVGAVGAGAGIYFLATAPKEQKPVTLGGSRPTRVTATVTPFLGVGSAGLSGTF